MVEGEPLNQESEEARLARINKQAYEQLLREENLPPDTTREDFEKFKQIKLDIYKGTGDIEIFNKDQSN